MTALPLVAALAWTVALISDGEPLTSAGSLLAGMGLVTTAAVAVVGMTVTGGRWAHRLAVISVGAGLTTAAIRPIDGFWVAATAASVVAGSALFLPRLTRRIRKLPAATGPPQTAVVLTLALLTLPFPLGLLADGSPTWAILVVGLTAPLFAFMYARVFPGGLLGVRVAWPLAALILAPMLSLAAGVLAGLSAVAIAALAWRPEVKASFHPPVEAGSTYAIPPELAPKEILDAARLDDRGRPK